MPKRWVVGGSWAALISAGLVACFQDAAAEQPTKPEKIIISEVIITGNRRVTTEQIKAHLRTQPNKEYKPAVVDEDVRALYKTGQFSNITMWLQPDGADHARIYFGIREIPNTVQKVTYLGAKHIKQDELQNITGVRPNTPLNPNLNRQGCQKILEHYAEMGRSFAECQLIKGGDLADTEVVYQITEGPKIKVRDIQFMGNNSAAAVLLRQMVATRVGDTYKRETAIAGMNAIYAFYRELGYRDVRIALETKRKSAPGEVTLIYHIHEEPRSRRQSSEPRP